MCRKSAAIAENMLLHVLVDIFRLDMIAETINIREQQLSLVTILRLDILIVELVQ